MSFRIIHPRPQAGRQCTFGINFTDGVAEVAELHPERRLALIQHGYSIEEEVPAVRLEDLTVRELRDVAEVEGIQLPSKATKAELIELISSAPVPSTNDAGWEPFGKQIPDYMPVQIMFRGEEVEIGRIPTDVATARYDDPGTEV